MADVRGKGKKMDEDIRSYLANKMTYKAFLREYGVEIARIVENNFQEDMLDVMESANGDETTLKEGMASVSNRISLFCAAFV
jgi:hypothetical protein